MPLPKVHTESLAQHVRIHEERLSLLREQLQNTPVTVDPNPKGDPNPKPPLPKNIRGPRELLEREIHFHEKLIGLARDPKLPRVLEDLLKDPEFAREAARDPRAAAQKRGIDLPAGVTLRLDGEGDRMRMRISSYDGLYPFLVTWDSESGFSPISER